MPDPTLDSIMGKPKKLTPEYMNMIDGLYVNPQERAQAIFNVILDHFGVKKEDDISELGTAFWDVFCFSTEFLGKAAIAFGNPLLLSIAKGAGMWTYNAHYFNYDQFLGPADRLFWRAKYGIQPIEGDGKEDAPVPSGPSGEPEDPDVPDIQPDPTSAQAPGSAPSSEDAP